MQIIPVATKDVLAIIRAADPSYRKRQCQIVPSATITLHDLNWSGGTRPFLPNTRAMLALNPSQLRSPIPSSKTIRRSIRADFSRRAASTIMTRTGLSGVKIRD